MPTTNEQPSRTCHGITEGWCARIGIAKAFDANAALAAHLASDAPLHPFQEQRDAAAALIGRGGCAEFASVITTPEEIPPAPAFDAFGY